MKIMKKTNLIILIENYAIHEKHKIPIENQDASIMKIMKIFIFNKNIILKNLEFHVRIMTIINIFEFHARTTKIMQIIEFQTRVMEIIIIMKLFMIIKKIMKILESHARNNQFIKVIEFNVRIMKITQILDTMFESRAS